MGAYLHAVPDPEPDEAPGPGEWPVLVAAPAVPAPRRAPEPNVDQHDDAPDETATPGPEEDDDNHVQDHDDAGAYDDEEVPAPRSFAVPDLRPYIDPRPLAALGPLAVEAGKTAGPQLLQAIGGFLRELVQMLTWYGRGIGVLLVLLAGWLSGKYGKKGSIGVRMGAVGFLLYAVAKLSTQHPYTPWIVGAVLLVATVLAATGRIAVPVSKPAKKTASKGEGKKKGATDKTVETPAKGKTTPTEKTPEGAVEEIPEVPKEQPVETPREPWAPRLFRRPAAPAATPAAPLAGDPAESPDEAAEPSAEGAVERVPATPQEDPLTTLLRAAIGSENGVHLGVLRPLMRDRLPGLSQATDKELREHIVQAGYDPSRTFRARGVAGRAGVHRTDLPSVPSPGDPPGSAGDHSPPTLHPSRPADVSDTGEQRRAAGEDGEWTRSEIARGFRCVADPVNGPSASRIERWDES